MPRHGCGDDHSTLQSRGSAENPDRCSFSRREGRRHRFGGAKSGGVARAGGYDRDRAGGNQARPVAGRTGSVISDRKSTRLNSSHLVISYAVFCFKKKKKKEENDIYVH